jgi:hypothetical protein
MVGAHDGGEMTHRWPLPKVATKTLAAANRDPSLAGARIPSAVAVGHPSVAAKWIAFQPLSCH